MPADPRLKNAAAKAPSVHDSEAQVAECDALEEALTGLRVAYEQYFMGVDRHPPLAQHTQLRQRLEKLKGAQARNAAVRFRINNLAQKTSTYERLWNRTLMEIENGVYRRDLFKVRRKNQESRSAPTKPEVAKPPDPPLEAPAQAAAAAAGAPAKSAPRPPERSAAKAAAPPGGTSSPPGTLSDEKVRAIYNAYVDAKQKCNEDTSRLNFDSLATTLRKQVPELLKRHQAQAVDFRVVIKDGKAILRAVPK